MGRWWSKGAATEVDPIEAALGDFELPSFPTVVLEALSVVRNPEASASEVARVLAPDPNITVKLLKLVNSVASGTSHKVTDMTQAVALAGVGTIESLLLGIGVKTAVRSENAHGFDHVQFWQAAAYRASVARSFANVLHPMTANHSFTVGLLQDMAVPVLANTRDDYGELLDQWHAGGQPLHALELETFGWSHDQLAARLCESWELPDELRDGVGGHHGDQRFSSLPGIEMSAPIRTVRGSFSTEQIISIGSDSHGLSPERILHVLEEARVDAAEVSRHLV